MHVENLLKDPKGRLALEFCQCRTLNRVARLGLSALVVFWTLARLVPYPHNLIRFVPARRELSSFASPWSNAMPDPTSGAASHQRSVGGQSRGKAQQLEQRLLAGILGIRLPAQEPEGQRVQAVQLALGHLPKGGFLRALQPSQQVIGTRHYRASAPPPEIDISHMLHLRACTDSPL